MMKTLCYLLAYCGLFLPSLAVEPVTVKVTVDNVERSALIYAPKSKNKDAKIPLVFGFHGHGGNAQQAAKSFRLYEAWPEACVVYMQGLPTAGQLTDPEGKRTGWQSASGMQGDRDLKFYDALLKKLRSDYPIDAKRIYATGHSNGGGFTYLLWAQRGKDFAAVAPCAAVGFQIAPLLEPKPCLHIAGTNDEIVKYAWQERMMTIVKGKNLCAATGTAWDKDCIEYAPATEEKGATFISFIYNGTHKYPTEAPALIVKFFKEHQLP
jgi:polyhydroxybutyrate depolymerase